MVVDQINNLLSLGDTTLVRFEQAKKDPSNFIVLSKRHDGTFRIHAFRNRMKHLGVVRLSVSADKIEEEMCNIVENYERDKPI